MAVLGGEFLVGHSINGFLNSMIMNESFFFADSLQYSEKFIAEWENTSSNL